MKESKKSTPVQEIRISKIMALKINLLLFEQFLNQRSRDLINNGWDLQDVAIHIAKKLNVEIKPPTDGWIH